MAIIRVGVQQWVRDKGSSDNQRRGTINLEEFLQSPKKTGLPGSVHFKPVEASKTDHVCSFFHFKCMKINDK